MVNNNWFSKHVDTVVVLGAIFGSFLWMNGKFNDVEKDLAVLKAVLVTKGIMSESLAVNKIEEGK